MITSQERLQTLERQAKKLQKRLETLSALNMSYNFLRAVVLIGGILAGLFLIPILHIFTLLIFVATIIYFIFASRVVRKSKSSFQRHQAWLQIRKNQIARMRLDWDALPSAPASAEPDHPFEHDLDITGPRSLHQLLNTSVSVEGTQLLQEWLLNREPDLDTLLARQALVGELQPLTRFRNRLLMSGLFTMRFSYAPVDAEELLSWLDGKDEHGIEQPIPKVQPVTFSIALALSAVTILVLILYIAGLLPVWTPIICFAISLFWFYIRSNERGDTIMQATRFSSAITQVHIVFEYLEKYPYAPDSLLRSFCSPFFDHADRLPSQLLKKFEQVSRLSSISSTGIVWICLNALIPLGFITARQLQQYRAHIAEELPTWLDAWYELEALCSLADFAYLNPEYTMPELVPVDAQTQTIVLHAEAVGHPLLKKSSKVVNDFTLSRPDEIMLITGSNMSGKSTFLRTLGINLCLAFAGAPVNATKFQTSLFELYACIKVSDSLADGYSYFYAEVRRLKGLLTMLAEDTQHPVFFMIDEIFKGTNNYERLIGSEAYIRALIGQNCLGGISTHDLELVELATSLPQIKNYHFREQIINEAMVFEYLLQEGPSPTRNALRVMQMEGLPVTWQGSPQPFQTAQPT